MNRSYALQYLTWNNEIWKTVLRNDLHFLGKVFHVIQYAEQACNEAVITTSVSKQQKYINSVRVVDIVNLSTTN